MVVTEIDLPGSVISLIKIPKEELGDFIKRSLAVELYREGKLSLGKASELAGYRNKWDMLMLLAEKGVPLDYTAGDAKEDLLTFKEVLGR